MSLALTRFFECTLGDDRRARRVFWWTLLLLTALRAWFAVALPMTSDEAYFAQWGRYPDWGFYDHPPMIGWWLALLERVSDHDFVLRLPALLAPPLIALLARASLARLGGATAWAAATLVLLVPLNAWNVAITTDIPLMLFSALVVALHLRARASGRSIDFLWTGLALAGALLSKYFAGLLAIALFVDLVAPPSRASLRGLFWIVLGALPGAAAQILWNMDHCWPNVMFNLINRNSAAGLSWQTPLVYLVTVAYVFTPFVLWPLLRGSPPTAVAGRTSVRSLRILALVPLALFAALSLFKTIGLHWLASFVFPAVLWLAWSAGTRALERALGFAAVLASLHCVLIGVLALQPVERFQSWSRYPGLVMTVHADELAVALAPWRATHAIASDGYSPAVTIGHALGQHVLVFGPGTSHARHDDILTDFRRLDGTDILIVRRRDDRLDEFDRYFEETRHETIRIRGAAFYLIDGRGFDYPRYRDEVLDEVRKRYYAVPRWLPGQACYFCERYFPDQACRAP